MCQRRIVWIVVGDGNWDAASSDGFNNVIVSQSSCSLSPFNPIMQIEESIAIDRRLGTIEPSAVFINDTATFITRQDRQTITC